VKWQQPVLTKQYVLTEINDQFIRNDDSTNKRPQANFFPNILIIMIVFLLIIYKKKTDYFIFVVVVVIIGVSSTGD
jgi:hypothetical protein